MVETRIIIEQIIKLGLLGLVGYFVGKTGYLSEETGKILSQFIVRVTLPILIFTSLVSNEFSNSIITDGITIFILTILFIFMAYILGHFMSKVLNVKEQANNIYKMQSMFGNIVFIGFPILTSIYGDKGILYALFFTLANDTILWTFGIYLVNKHKSNNWKSNLKHLVNGNTIAYSIGLILMIIGFQNILRSSPVIYKGYEIFYQALSPLGKTTSPLSMVYIGLILSEVRVNSTNHFIRRLSIFILSFFKLLLVPAIACCILYFFGGPLPGTVKGIIIIQLAMPCGLVVTALASQFESDYKYASEAAFCSTIASAFTLPLIVYMVTNLV